MRIDNPMRGERILVRNYEKSDLEFLTGMWFHEENGKYMSDPTAEYVDQAYQKALDTLGESELGYYLVIELADTGESVGSFCMFPDERKKVYDIGYCIHRKYWKSGYGSEALGLALEWIRARGGEKVTAEVAVGNLASNALLRKFGFAVERRAEFSKYHMDVRFDSYIYARVLTDLRRANALSVGSYGCNLRSPFCQNHEISMGGREEAGGMYVPPKLLADTALEWKERKKAGNIGVAFTYNEPLVGWEYVRDTTRLVREYSMENVLVTNGTVSLEVLEELLPYIDAMNIDLKGFREGYYRKLGGDLETVKRFITRASADCHVELTTLIVPGENDGEDEMEEEARWIAVLSLARILQCHSQTGP